MTEVYRNHPAVIVKNTASFSVALIIISVSMVSPIPLLLIVPLGLFFAVAWWRTHLTVYGDHAVAESNIISKRSKTIPLGKVASVNEVQGLFGRIFGWTTVQININSSQNYGRPEISFMFRTDVAAYIIPLVKYGSGIRQETADTVFETEEPVPAPEVPVFSFTFMDALVFGIAGSSTYSLVSAAFWGAVSVITFLNDATASLLTIFMFVFTGLLQIVTTIIKHANFRVYRSGTTIRMVYGLITIYETAFDVSKVNAVCVKRAFFPRLFKRCCLQAEVVGINAEAKSVTPNVTLLIPESRLEYAMRFIFPEFITDYEVTRQPRDGAYPTFSKAAWSSLAYAGITAAIAWLLILDGELERSLVIISAAAIAATLTIASLAHAYLALGARRMGMGGEMFTTVNGVLDSSEHIMPYSKMQIVRSIQSPMARKHGVAKMRISLLTASGGIKIPTGFYHTDDVEKVGETAVEQSGREIQTIEVRNGETVVGSS